MTATKATRKQEANPLYLPVCAHCSRPIESPALIEDTLAIVGRICPRCEKLRAKGLLR